MSDDMRTPPWGGSDVPWISSVQTGNFHCYKIDDQGLSNLYLTESMAIQAMQYVGIKQAYESSGSPLNSPHFTLRETTAAWNLIRSKLWQDHHMPDRINRAFLRQEELDRLTAAAKTNAYRADIVEKFVLNSFESQLEEAANLTFDEKCTRTLENIFTLIGDRQKCYLPPNLTYSSRLSPLFTAKEGTADGIAYGCNEAESAFVLESLFADEILRLHYGPGNIPDGVELTSKAYSQIDKLRKGKNESIKQAFFIRRWDQSRDRFFDKVRTAVQEQTGCAIRAVWDVPHNDKIDDRILRLIRESPVVVLDIDETRFNVGLEAGYALAGSVT